MAAVDLLTIGVVFIFGVLTGVVLLVSLASRREDRRARLSREAPDRVTHAGRLLTGLYVRRPGDDRNRRDLFDHDEPGGFSGPLRYSDPEARPRRLGKRAPGSSADPETGSRT
jgi:hypothetical protein